MDLLKLTDFHLLRVKNLAARVIFKLSVVSFDVCFKPVESHLKNMKPDMIDQVIANLIEYTCFDMEKLARMINLIRDSLVKFKANAFMILAEPLRAAIWNWITNYPSQLINFTKKKELQGYFKEAPLDIFEGYGNFTAKKGKDNVAWPVMTMLLMLAPDALSTAIMGYKQNTKTDTKRKEKKFITTIVEAIKKDKSTDTPAICVVDLFKLSSYISKTDMKSLRFLAAEVQPAIQEKIIVLEGTPIKKDGKVDIKLMVDFIVGSFRVNPRNATSYQFTLLFQGNITYKLALTKALLQLAKEGAALPWHPTLSNFYSVISKSLRKLLQDVVNYIQQEQTKNPVPDKKEISRKPTTVGPVVVETPHSLDCLLNLLTLFYTDPKMLLYPAPSNNPNEPNQEHKTQVLYAFGVLCKCLEEKHNFRVQNQAYKLLLKLFSNKYIQYWFPGDLITGFIEVSSQVLSSLSAALLDSKDLQGRLIKTNLDLIKELTYASNKFIAKNKDKITHEHIKNRKRIASFKNLEKNLLTLLCSPDTEVWITAASCFADICDQIDVLGDLEDKKNSIALNYNLYRKISSVEELGKTTEKQQQGIRQILRSTTQTDANMATFLEVKTKWKDLKKALIENVKDPNNPDGLEKGRIIWKNYTEFLVSLGGICMKSEEQKEEEKQTGKIDKAEKGKKLAVELVTEIIEIMITSNKNNNYVAAMKNDLTGIIGNELHSALYGLLFEYFHKQVSTFFNEDGSLQTSIESTQFVEKAIQISRMLIENTQKGALDMESVDFESLVTSFIKYCNYLPATDKAVEPIKTSICTLVTTLIDKRDIFKLKNDIQFRTSTMNLISEWTSDFVHKLSEKKETEIQNREKDYPLDISCMTAISSLLKDLPFKEYKDFLKLFGFFIRYLHSCANDNSSNAVKLRQITVIALGNLLESNFNFGLDQFLKYIYIERKETVRTSFLDVLTNITKKGIQLQQEQKGEKKDMYSSLYDLLVEDNMSFTMFLLATVPVQDQDNLCSSLMRIFEMNNRALDLLRLSIDQEIAATYDKSVLFRANSSSSKMLTAFMRYSSKTYMTNAVGNLVQKIVGNATHFEVDETKLKEGEKLEENIANLDTQCKAFLDCIQLYVDEIPYKIRMIINYMWKKVDGKFPSTEEDTHSARHLAVGAVLFLRFLCPAIVSPQSNGLVDSPPDGQAARFLMLVTKVLQNVANGVPFGQKEKAMNPLNKFITDNLPNIRAFFDDVATIPDGGDESTIIIRATADEKKSDWECIYRYIFKAFDDIKKKVEETKANPILLTHLNGIITEIGKPAEEAKEQQTYISKEFKSAEMTKFMAPFETQDLTEYTNKQFCYCSGVSIEKRPVMYFIARQFFESRKRDKPDEIHDVVIYVILKQLQSIFTRPYDIVIDCTGWNQVIKDGYLLKILTLLPVGARKNCTKVIFYNPNTHTAKQFAKLGKFTLLSKKLFKKFHFLTGTKELFAHIDEKNNYLPETTVKYDADVQNTFGKSSLFIKGDPTERKLTNIKLNYSYLFIIGDEKLGGLPGKIVDFFPIIGMNNVALETDQQTVSFNYVQSNIDRRFSIKIENAPTLYETIMKGIQRIKSDLALSNSMAGDPTASKESIKTSDVPGAMLNMCFLSLESNNPKTRTAAYNLLVALAEQFSFPVTVMENRDLCVPHNTNDLVVVLSSQVAKAKQGLTISFLKAALKGYNLYTKTQKSMMKSSAKLVGEEEDEGLAVPYKYLALKYIKPWIPNVAPFYEENQSNPEEMGQVKEWFSELTQATINDKDIYPALLNEVWSEISKDPSLVKLAIESVIGEGIEKGIGKEGDILGDLVVTLASSHQSAKFVVTVILEAILAAIEDAKDGEENWEKITVLCRYLLMLSFQNRINVNDNLSTLLYIIALAAGKSSYVLRSTLHGLTMNLTHSLCTSHKMSNDIKKQMQDMLHDLTMPEYKELFMENGNTIIDPYATFVKEKSKPVEIDMWKHEKLVIFLAKIISTCYKLEPNTKKKYFSEWNVLIQQSSSKMNFETLPRLMVIYGVLAHQLAVKDSIPFVFNLLNASLFMSQKKDIPVSTLLCMTQFCGKISADDDILKVFFVVSLILFGGADEKLFVAALTLFKQTLIAISHGKQYKECASLEEYFKKYIRTEKNEPFIADLEKATQMSFSTHFSFVLSGLLVRGLTSNPSTREKTSDLFVTLLDVSKMLNPKIPDLLGYISALIPFNYDKIYIALGQDFVFYNDDNFSHKLAPVLFTRFLMAIVQSVSDYPNPTVEDNFELKKVVIFKVIQEVFEKIATPFFPVFSEVLSRTITYYKTACSVNQKKLAEVTLQLINTLMMNPDAALKESPSSLKEINFTGIDRLRSFTTTTVSLSKPTFTVLGDYLKSVIGSCKVDSLPNEEIYLMGHKQETPQVVGDGIVDEISIQEPKL